MSPLGWPLEGQSLISGEANSLPKSPGQFFQSEGSSLYGQKSSPSGSLHRSFPKGLQTKVISISSHLSYTLQTVRPPHQVLRSSSAHGACTYQRCPPDGTRTFHSFSFSISMMNLHGVRYWGSQGKVGFRVIVIIYPHSWKFSFSLPEAWKGNACFYQCPSGHTLICQHSSESKRSKLGAPLTHPSSTPTTHHLPSHPPPIQASIYPHFVVYKRLWNVTVCQLYAGPQALC